VGKPNPQLLLTALDRLGEGRTLVVGDRVDADLAAAADAELDAALVKTGGQTETDAAGAKPQPVAVADTLADLILR
jgi:ribonucleotide monophosphatase NagD (HAD superfamily)